MKLNIPRRDFLKVTACTLAASTAISALTDELAAQTTADARLKRIGCTTVCFRSRFPATRTDKTPADDDLTLLEVPRLFADALDVHNVELWSQHFAELSLDYCRQLRQAASDAGSKIINIQLDVPGYNLSNPHEAEREKSVELVKSWMDRAAACGSPSIRANTGGGKQPFHLQNTGDAYRQLAVYGQQIGVKVLIENHGGYSANADNIVALAEYVDSPFCRTLPDFGNVPTDYSWEQRSAFLRKLLPDAELISAKGMVFDNNYQHQGYDIGACVRLAESSGFRGIYSVELWDQNYQPADPIRAVRQIIRTITTELV